MLVYWAAVLAIGGVLAAVEFQKNFYILYPLAALVGSVHNTNHAWEILFNIVSTLPSGLVLLHFRPLPMSL